MALRYVPGFLASVYDDVLDDFMREMGTGHSPYGDDARYPYTLPHNALRFGDIADLRAQVKASGSHYFDRDAIRFFNARTHGDLSSGRFWVESVKHLEDPRRYRVSWVSQYVNPEGEASLSVEHSRYFDSLADARLWRTRLARAVEHAESAQA